MWNGSSREPGGGALPGRPGSLASAQEQEDFEQELVDQFLLAAVDAGMGDAMVNKNQSVIFEFARFLGRPLWTAQPHNADAFLARQRTTLGRAKLTVQHKAWFLARFYDFLLLRYEGDIRRLTGHVVIQVIDEFNRPAKADYGAMRVPPAEEEVEELFAAWRAWLPGARKYMPAARDYLAASLWRRAGLRIRETYMLDVRDWRRDLGEFGKIHVRYGKGSRGRGAKTRPVPASNQAGDLLDWWLVEVRHLGLEAAFAQFVRDHAAAHGWAKNYTATIQRAIRIMLGIQDTPGALIRRSDIMLLTRIKHLAATVTVVIAAAGMLDDDIEPPVVRWFNAKVAALPDQMRRELGVWLEVMRTGSTIPPRSSPQADETICAQLAFALPVLRAWAATRDSLREISRADVLAALPPSGQPRATTVQGLRSIFRILRARKLVFTNPTLRIHVPAQAMSVPPAVGLAAMREALDSPSPARVVITALDDRVILLAEPVRDRVDAYLSYRAATWPTTVNAYLFVHARSWKTTRPVTSAWISHQLAISAEHIRLDRIYQEVEATGGDIRALCDLFGMSIANAARWAATIDRITELPALNDNSDIGPWSHH